MDKNYDALKKIIENYKKKTLTKVIKSYSIDKDLVEKMEKIVKKNNIKASDLVNLILRDYLFGEDSNK